MTAQRSWREALTRHVVKTWLDKDRFRHVNHLVKGSENPEYRIAVDVRIATDAPIDLALVFFGHHLTGVIERTNQAEAEFRAAVDAFREEGEHLTPRSSDIDKRQILQLKLQAVLLWWREFCWQLVRTTLVSHGNGLFAPVVGWLLCVPKYLSGAMSLVDRI